jgi:hypothetical protein
VAEQIRAEVEADRAAVVHETDQVREFRDGCWTTWVGVHGEISGLLERTRMQRELAGLTQVADRRVKGFSRRAGPAAGYRGGPAW